MSASPKVSIITTSGGGMLVSQNLELVERARYLATQAREPASHYEHRAVGYNYRLSNLLAAVGRGQLRVLRERVRRRREIFEFYRSLLSNVKGLGFMPEAPHGKCTRWLTCITLDEKRTGATSETVRLALEGENIESRSVWKPMHMQPVFQGFEVVGGGVSERLFETGLCLPSGTAMGPRELERIARALDRCLLT